MPGIENWSPHPVMIDGRQYPSSLDAARALAPDPSKLVRVYSALRRALGKGERAFMGRTISYAPPPRRRYDTVAMGSDSDFGKLVECPAPDRRLEREPGSGPLLRYPFFESPLYRGIRHYH
jgi:hypothetical protein